MRSGDGFTVTQRNPPSPRRDRGARYCGTNAGVGHVFRDSPPKHHCVNPGSRQASLLLKVGDVDIELFEPTGEPSTWQQYLAQHREGFHSVAFHIPGMQNILVQLAPTRHRSFKQERSLGEAMRMWTRPVAWGRLKSCWRSATV